MANQLSPWCGRLYGVVDRRGDGGEIAFPGLLKAVAVSNASRFLIKGVPLNEFPVVAGVDITPNMSRPKMNGGWVYAALGVAGDDLSDPIAKVQLNDWDPLQTKAEYQNWEHRLAENIQLAAGEDVSTVLLSRKRLEGVVGFVEEGSLVVHWDMIRIYRVKNALKNPAGPTKSHDWMAYKFSELRGNQESAQEGGGHGPPDLE